MHNKFKDSIELDSVLFHFKHSHSWKYCDHHQAENDKKIMNSSRWDGERMVELCMKILRYHSNDWSFNLSSNSLYFWYCMRFHCAFCASAHLTSTITLPFWFWSFLFFASLTNAPRFHPSRRSFSYFCLHHSVRNTWKIAYSLISYQRRQLLRPSSNVNEENAPSLFIHHTLNVLFLKIIIERALQVHDSFMCRVFVSVGRWI